MKEGFLMPVVKESHGMIHATKLLAALDLSKSLTARGAWMEVI